MDFVPSLINLKLNYNGLILDCIEGLYGYTKKALDFIDGLSMTWKY